MSEELYLILIVDDNPNNIKVLFNFLKKYDFRVLVSTSGEDALRKLQEVTPDLILLDVMMPKIDGFEVCRRLKENSKTQDIPVLFMTALSETEHKVKGFELGAVDYITKPLQQEEVLSRVRLHLKLHELNRSLQEKNQQLTEEIAARLAVEVELQQLNQQLEQRVKERTQELYQTLTQLQIGEEKLSYEATHDSLTGLYNRAWLMQFLSEKIVFEKLYADDCAVLFLDLEQFKNINNWFGHFAGDKLLKKVAIRLQDCLQFKGKIARLGGGDFLIILPGKWKPSESENLVKQLFRQLQTPFDLESYQIFVGASIGIVPSIVGYQKPTDILRDADIAVYEAKQMGRGCYVVLTPEMQSQALERIQLESLLRGIEQEQFCLYYQPIFELKTQRLVGFEALIRWKHPEQGIIPPGVFLEVAEKIGVISELDGLAFKLACQQLEQWKQLNLDFLPIINVNCSAKRLQQPEMIEQVSLILKTHKISASHLKIEVTESGFLKTANKAINILESLHRLGIKLCIDDFGTGYSSLSRLHNFPLDTLKIDRSFIMRLTNNLEGESIVQTIISLAHRLSMDVVAEGIETLEQLEKLIELECEFGQGYLFSKPLPSEQATQFLLEYSHLTN